MQALRERLRIAQVQVNGAAAQQPALHRSLSCIHANAVIAACKQLRNSATAEEAADFCSEVTSVRWADPAHAEQVIEQYTQHSVHGQDKRSKRRQEYQKKTE